MTKPKPLTAAQRKNRKKIRGLILKARALASNWRSDSMMSDVARLVDDLAKVAEEYLEVMKHGKD